MRITIIALLILAGCYSPPQVAISRDAGCIPANTQRDYAQVIRVIDGDTIEVMLNGQVFRVRYLGMNTPEWNEPGGTEATRANENMVEGKIVLMVRDVSEVDRSGRLLRYVLVGNTFVNQELVIEGYAEPATYPPDVACKEALQ